ncbi:hypothetical protein [Carnobacterium maltaromaticum]|uniref:hypothetical protein n=1 Tax=Carnobacterium maltaromaticum TaxID=2751 RepID=UPI0012F9F0CF|nr:hypothetical protein [Carnobacterium maltaromaticum]
MNKIYRNYNELVENNTKLAVELLDEKGKGNWQKEEIYSHDDIQSFAEYELTEGWYIDLNIDKDFNGAPNPLDFIDLEELGDALVRNWDNSCHFKSINGEILQTSHGW